MAYADGPLRGLDVSATLGELMEYAVGEENASCDSIVAELTSQACARNMCEVREVRGLPPRFTGVSVVGVNADKGGNKLMLRLAGNDCGSEVASDVYHGRCILNSSFKGFAFFVITAAEDMVGALAIDSALLKYRLVLYKPAEHIDFALCCLCAFLENCTERKATPSLFVQANVFLQNAWSKVGPFTKIRRMLCVSATWLLNTLMSSTGIAPFEPSMVLPHHFIMRQVCVQGCASVLSGLYEEGKRVDSEQLDKQSCDNYDIRAAKGYTVFLDGLLNGAFRHKWVEEVLFSWWASTEPKLTGTTLFYDYEREM